MSATAVQAPSPFEGGYERRRPEESLLYQVVQGHWSSFAAALDREGDGRSLPAFIRQEFDTYLRCGILAHGFVRARCSDCADSRLVAFSCKRRGFCPSCIGRRMNETAAHLVDGVFPEVPVRQWVLTVPHGLRYALAHSPALTAKALRIFVAAITWWLRRRLRRRKLRGTLKTGAVTVIQRFDSALALNVHFHTLVFDGAYARDRSGRLIFHPAPTPDEADVALVAERVFRRVLALLEDEAEAATVRAAQEDPALASLSAASLRRLVATGPRRGRPVRRLGADEAPRVRMLGRCCAEVEGFNVHAAVRVAANDRPGLESLCRYIARPPLSIERLATLPDGNLSLRLKRRWSDGTTHLVFSPGELIEKLIPLVPRPRAHVIRYHGVLAPAAGWRREIVPARPSEERRSVAKGRDETGPPKKEAGRIPWAELLMRVFRIEVLLCRRCGGPMTVLAAVMNQAAATAILRHLDLPVEAPTVLLSRAPPEPPDSGASSATWDGLDPPAPSHE